MQAHGGGHGHRCGAIVAATVQRKPSRPAAVGCPRLHRRAVTARAGRLAVKRPEQGLCPLPCPGRALVVPPEAVADVIDAGFPAPIPAAFPRLLLRPPEEVQIVLPWGSFSMQHLALGCPLGLVLRLGIDAGVAGMASGWQ